MGLKAQCSAITRGAGRPLWRHYRRNSHGMFRRALLVRTRFLRSYGFIWVERGKLACL
jgi:hypothetical protein